MTEDTFTITLRHKGGYEFLAAFDQPGLKPLFFDEPPPLGNGRGPNAARVLAAAVGNCLSASALFCLERAHIEVLSMHTEVTVNLARNENGRMRVSNMAVRIEPEVAEEDIPRMTRCLEIFEDYCLVTQSVRQGIDINVAVETRAPAAV